MKKIYLLTLLPLFTFISFSQDHSSFSKLQPVIENYLDIDLDSAEKYALILLENANTENTNEHHAYNYLAHISYRKGNKLEALENFEHSLRQRKLKGKTTEIANTQNWIGRIYHELADYDLAINYYLQALETLHQGTDSAYTLQTINNLSKLYLDLENYVQANNYNLQAIAIGQNISDSLELANAFNLRGIYCQENKQKDSAGIYYEKALDYYLLLHQNSRIGQEYNNLGIIYFLQHNYSKAYDWLLKGLAIRKTMEDSSYYAQSLQNLGDYHYFLHQPDSAEYYYLTGLDVAQKSNSSNDIKDLAFSLSDLYFSRKEYDQAYRYLLLYTSQKDQILNTENLQNIEMLEAKYQFKNQKEQLALIAEKNLRLKELNAQLESDQFYRNLIIYTLSGCILLLGIFYYKRVRA